MKYILILLLFLGTARAVDYEKETIKQEYAAVHTFKLTEVELRQAIFDYLKKEKKITEIPHGPISFNGLDWHFSTDQFSNHYKGLIDSKKEKKPMFVLELIIREFAK